MEGTRMRPAGTYDSPPLLEPMTADLERRPPAHPCAFAQWHHEPSMEMFHSDDGPTFYVEWLEESAILARGPRSWVCERFVDLTYQFGKFRFVSE